MAKMGKITNREIRKTSSRCPRSVGDAELGHFTLLLEEDGKGIQRFSCMCSAIVLLIKPFVNHSMHG